MNKLWIFGDSFTSRTDKGTWPALVADQWHLTIMNHSLPGASPDWIWDQLRQQMDQIEPNDRIIVILTEPSRFWYWPEWPEMTNLNNIAADLTQGQRRAMESYVLHLQRPQLDCLWLEWRLGWLHDELTRRDQQAMIVMAFDQYVERTERWPRFCWVQGTLIEASTREIAVGQHLNWEARPQDILTLWTNAGFRGCDPRIGHVSLSNHQQIAQGLMLDQPRIAYQQQTVYLTRLEDTEWCQQELDWPLVQRLRARSGR